MGHYRVRSTGTTMHFVGDQVFQALIINLTNKYLCLVHPPSASIDERRQPKSRQTTRTTQPINARERDVTESCPVAILACDSAHHADQHFDEFSERHPRWNTVWIDD